MGAKDIRRTAFVRLLVSIHAPVMGANRHTPHGFRASASFNPRTRDGCELNYENIAAFDAVSIHAPVMGANLKMKVVALHQTFQSTHP